MVLALFSGCESFKDQEDAAKLRWDKASAEIKLKLARENFATGQYDNAKRAVADCLKVDDQNTQAYLLAGKIAMVEADFDQAIICCNKAVDIDAKLDKAWFLLGNAYEYKSDVIMASESYLKAFRIDSSNSKYVLSVARCYISMGRLEQAKTFLEENMKSNKNNIALKLEKANVEMQMGNYDVAINCYRQVVLLSGGDRENLKSLGYCYISAKQWENAAEIFSRLLSTTDDAEQQKELSDVLSVCELNSGQFANVASRYDKISSENRDNPQFWVELGRAHLGNNSPMAALACSNRALNIDPFMIQAKHVKAAAQYLNKEYRACVITCENIISSQPDSSFAWMMSGRAYERLGNVEEAKLSYDKAVSIKPESQELLRLASNVN